MNESMDEIRQGHPNNFMYFAFWQTGTRVGEFIQFLEEHRERQ